ncbi:myocardin-related transcription factor A isoform X1 [Danio rerio]|uniref:Myocardin-related transcription factor A isoform X1 n=8 Tax=Danio rerio TaxID=7955 RepID=A0A8M3AQH5_DANRE|nr:MKL/myocardin-like protein 1 [Danio rerio]XP_021329355.1 MKL/myocardin-like protein 1 [Danio rerio]XP_021329361.1 MKL/myocardin-like protein 1 [Danio rerio]XP_021329362.1 MKL/myocardin-like protein 1 [Danio rerio]|eukprot:XP_021329349.1 MKL/myocardin-like protein 1 [Danio rerio]
MEAMEEESKPIVPTPAVSTASASSPQSEAVTNELQDLSLQPAPNLPPIYERKNVLQLKLQQRRTREELVDQGIMPPLKSSASFHEQRRSLERARTEDYLKRKIRSRPERSELVRMHILEETSAEPSLQAKQLLLKRARLADDLNDKISQRPGPMELVHKNILPVHSSIKQAIIETEFPKVEAENSSFDEESSDAFSPEQTAIQDSPLGHTHLPTSAELPANEATPKQVPPPPPPALPSPTPQQKLLNGTTGQKQAPALQKSGKVSSERPAQRSKKVRDNKPKVKKLKYHQYVPPDQKAEREPPPLLDSSYAKLLYQQQLFLQLQIINQQQQNYNYHTILPAPPKPPADQQPALANGQSQSKNDTPPQSTSTNLTSQNQQSTINVGRVNISPLPPNLEELKVAELKQELKLRGLTVSGTKNDLIERLRNFQEQNGGTSPPTPKTNTPSALGGGASSTHQSTDRNLMVASFQFGATAEGGGTLTTAPMMMQFGSTSSSPPVSPAHSERSSTGMSPDEASCHADAFGEMVSSPLTQLSLQPSPPLPTTVCIKEEPCSQTYQSSSCMLSRSADKDQMLLEKDRRIQELTNMLLQKQQLVESLRLQLEGKRVQEPNPVKEALPAAVIEALRVTVKEEVMEVVEDSEMVTEPQVELEQQQRIVMRQNQRNLLQQTHQRKRKTQKQQRQFPQALTNQQSSPVSSVPVSPVNPNSTPTIVTDGNGNQFLLTLSNQHTEAPARGRRPQGKATNQSRLQRLQSTSTTLPNQSEAELLNNNNQPEPIQTVILKQPIKKALKPDLNVATNYKASSSSFVSTSFFSSVDSMNDGDVVPSSPNNNNNIENVSQQHVDDLFDILIQRGEISENFKASPDPVLERLRPNTPLTLSFSPLNLSPASENTIKTLIAEPRPPSIKVPTSCATGAGRLEDFLESTTGKPLLGVEPGGPTTLIVDLHNQMLSTPSILDHPRCPMDTYDISFSSHSASDLVDSAPDSMDWMELGVGASAGEVPGLVHINGHNPSSLFSADFLDTSDLNWSSL